ADPHLEDASADAFGGGDRGVAAALENRAEHEIINRRPARIRLGDRLLVELCARQIGHGSVSFRPPFAPVLINRARSPPSPFPRRIRGIRRWPLSGYAR